MIAEQYEKTLVEGGWKHLSDKMLARYFKGYSSTKWKAMKLRDPAWNAATDKQVADYFRAQGGTNVRLRHAEDFAKHGAKSVWFALIPVSIAADAKRLEGKLTTVVEKWNKQHGYPPLLRGRA